jgi:hypothetical protein
VGAGLEAKDPVRAHWCGRWVLAFAMKAVKQTFTLSEMEVLLHTRAAWASELINNSEIIEDDGLYFLVRLTKEQLQKYRDAVGTRQFGIPMKSLAVKIQRLLDLPF